MRDMSNRSYWQRMARFYAPFMKGSDPLYDAICDRIRSYLSKEMEALELACGCGQLSYRLAAFVRPLCCLVARK